MLILACLPIGDVRDVSAHLIQVIQDAKYVAAEDSRKFSRLCQELNIKHNAKVISFFEGNESERLIELTTILKSQKDVLVVTDAGAPGISDPGYRLIRAALAENIQVKVLTGPSAVTTALLLSGLPTDRFCFEGFPPRYGVVETTLSIWSERKWTELTKTQICTICVIRVLYKSPSPITAQGRIQADSIEHVSFVGVFGFETVASDLRAVLTVKQMMTD